MCFWGQKCMSTIFFSHGHATKKAWHDSHADLTDDVGQRGAQSIHLRRSSDRRDIASPSDLTVDDDS